MADIDTFDDLKPQPSSRPVPTLLMSLERRVFTPGQTYTFVSKNGRYSGERSSEFTKNRRFMFLRDEEGAGNVVHHIFQLKGASYLESFTDAQCLDYNIEVAS